MIQINDLTGEQAKALLNKITLKLNTLDEEDFFGTEGWKHYLGLDKEI